MYRVETDSSLNRGFHWVWQIDFYIVQKKFTSSLSKH